MPHTKYSGSRRTVSGTMRHTHNCRTIAEKIAEKIAEQLPKSDCRMRRRYHFGAVSHLGTAPHIPLTQFENQAYRLYVIQVFSSA
jgi:hypothetical protein